MVLVTGGRVQLEEDSPQRMAIDVESLISYSQGPGSEREGKRVDGLVSALIAPPFNCHHHSSRSPRSWSFTICLFHLEASSFLAGYPHFSARKEA